ncbi:MAG: carboxylate-amine ligase [Roseivirga sp.]|nr:carboxylate-amine ligase [Roseivirga sp.]
MQFTLGIEEEYQVIDPETRALVSHKNKIVTEAEKVMANQATPELHEAMVEVGTNICTDIKDARKQVSFLRKSISDIASDLGYRIGAAGSHPFSHWADQPITPKERYQTLINELQDTARSNLIFGLHVHVGIDDPTMRLHVANSIRYFLPHIYALSTNSPFWEGRNTGFKSFRPKVFNKFPRTGIPDYFESLSEYNDYIDLLIKTGCIDEATKIWWDIRIHPKFPTIEIRICDIPLTVDETITIAAVIQALCAKLVKLRQGNMNYMSYKRSLITENKWRASRYGIDGKLIDFGKEAEVPMRQLFEELVDFVDDVVDDLDSREEVESVFKIFENGTGADRQLKVFEETGDVKDVVDYIISQTSSGLG